MNRLFSRAAGFCFIVGRMVLPLALALSSAGALADAAGFPTQATITMRGYWNYLPVGKAVQSWTLNGDKYRLENRLSGLGYTLRYLSEGHVDGTSLKPDYYAEFRGKSSAPKYESRFDWSKKTVSFGKPGDPRFVDMQSPIQDLNALPFDIAWRDAKPTTYAQLSNGRKLKRASILKEAEQSMRLGDRSYKVVYMVSRLPKETVEFWLAPELHYLPLKIKYDGSENIEMIAKKVEIDGRVVAED